MSRVHPNLICLAVFTLPITECSDIEGPGFLMQYNKFFVKDEGNEVALWTYFYKLWVKIRLHGTTSGVHKGGQLPPLVAQLLKNTC